MGHADHLVLGQNNVIHSLNDALSYDPETGDIVWKKSRKGIKSGSSLGNVSKRRNTFYKECCVDGNRYYVHVLAWALYYGEFPKGHIDHIDGNGLNNKISNLRDVNPVINGRNHSRSKANRSGVTGVYWNGRKWIANICLNYKTKYLGSFDDIEEAKMVRKEVEKRYLFTSRHGESHHGAR